MLAYLLPDFLQACTADETRCQVLSLEQSRGIRDAIRQTFPSVHLKTPIDFYAGSGLQHSEPWTLLSGMLSGTPVYFLFAEDAEERIIHIDDGGRLSKLIGDLNYFLEYVITDEQISFLLGEHHSGILMGIGRAENWISGMKKKMQSEKQ
jgi:hypothetical protein